MSKKNLTPKLKRLAMKFFITRKIVAQSQPTDHFTRNDSDDGSSTGTDTDSNTELTNSQCQLGPYGDGIIYYNNYNNAIDQYNTVEFIDPCEWADNARGWADLQLTFEDDPTLAEHFNLYLSSPCNLSQLIV